MNRYSFTGPTDLDAAGRARACAVVEALDDPTEITTGAAAGWDMAIAFAALEAWPEAHHRVVCPGAAFDRQGLGWLIERAIALRVEHFTTVSMPPERTAGLSYRRRNEMLVDHGDTLVAAVRSLTFYRSGEFMTVNIAKKRGVPVRFELLQTPARSGNKFRP